MYLVAKDMQDLLTRYLGNKVADENLIKVRMSINDALKELWGEHTWSWYQGQTVMQFDAPYETGTITFVYSTLRLTLTGGTWPTWAVYGTIRVGTKYARITKRISDTVVEIESGTSFIADIASATSFKLYRSEYPIAANIRKMSYLYVQESGYRSMRYVPPSEYRSIIPGALGNSPAFYTVQRDRQVLGGLVLVVWPFPNRAYTIRYSYIRLPYDVSVWGESTGKIACTADGNSVTGTGTAFESLHAECLLRVGRDALNVPTPRYGQYPYSHETRITDVASTTSLTVEPVHEFTRSNAKYLISNLVDIDEPIMRSAFTQQCFFELAKHEKMDDKSVAVIDKQRSMALQQAKSKNTANPEITYAGSFNSDLAGSLWFTVEL